MTVAEKVRMAEALGNLGIDLLEAGFPIASDGDYEAVRAISQRAGGRVAALARARRADIERAAEALAPAKAPRLHTFIATSDVHLVCKLRMSREQALADAVAAVELARQHVDDVEFSAEDATRTDPGFLEEVARATVDAGAATFNIPDTVGYSTPDEFGDLVARVVAVIGDRAVVSVHCHNDLGLAVANSVAAVRAGARQVECTINGIGERAGNCALEELVMILKVRQDRLPYTTGVITERLFPASQLLTGFISFGPQPNKAIVGRNAFAHEAGIHQDGVLKERTTYEIMDPRTVGVPESRIVLGKHSGRHALAQRCLDLGYPLEPGQLNEVYRRFVAAADQRKRLVDGEIAEIADEVVNATAGVRHRRPSEAPWIGRFPEAL